MGLPVNFVYVIGDNVQPERPAKGGCIMPEPSVTLRQRDALYELWAELHKGT
jgi:hypothetical protein